MVGNRDSSDLLPYSRFSHGVKPLVLTYLGRKPRGPTNPTATFVFPFEDHPGGHHRARCVAAVVSTMY